MILVLAEVERNTKIVVEDNMSENKKLAIVIIAIVVGIMLILLLGSGKDKDFLATFESNFNGEENYLVYVGRESCAYCELMEPSLIDMAERYDFEYLKVDTEELSASTVGEIIGKAGHTSIGTPYLMIVSNGEVVTEQEGYTDYDKTFELLQEYNIIKEEATLNLNYIDIDEYEQLLNSEEMEVVVIGQSTCGYCVTAKPILNDINEEYGLKINYLNTSYIETQEDFDRLVDSLDYFDNEWGTPVTLILQNGKLVDVLENLNTEAKYVEFFKEVGVINE